MSKQIYGQWRILLGLLLFIFGLRVYTPTIISALPSILLLTLASFVVSGDGEPVISAGAGVDADPRLTHSYNGSVCF